MNIVVLDAHTLNPGDLSWSGLEQLGSCAIYPRSTPEQVIERSAKASVVLINKIAFGREALEQLLGLRYIGITATGYNVVDVAAARDRGITVTNVPAYGTRSVAQMTFALLLELTQHVGHHAQSVGEGRWSQSPDFCYWDYPLVELAGLTLGIIGYGRIGQCVAGIGQAFGMRIMVCTRTPAKASSTDVCFGDLETVFRSSDVLSLHCPLTPETRHVVNAERLSWMKPGALLLNTSRGQLVDEAALAQALSSGRLGGAGLDVLEREPPVGGSPLIAARNCLVTPHIAWATRAARSRLLQVAVENVRCFLAGTPQNVVS